MTLAQSANGSAIAKRPMTEITADVMSGFEHAANEAKKAYCEASTSVLAPLVVAAAMADLRAYLDDEGIKQRILALMNTPIGFRTDRDPKIERWDKKQGKKVAPTPYTYDIVKDCVIEAMLRGLHLVGNQFNIISGRTYITKEGFEYLIRPLPSVKNFRPIIGVPIQKPSGAIIDCSATWLQNGEAMSIEVTIPVKGDEQTATADQYIGKATRKLLKRCYEMMTGNSLSDGESDELTMVEPVSVTEVTPDVASVMASVPTLSSGQLEQLRTSMANVLSATGAQAFELDAAAGFGVDSIESIPATAMRGLMQNLGNSEYQELWNQGLGVSGERLIEPEQAEESQEHFEPAAAPAMEQPELIPAEQPRRSQPIRRQSAAEPENEL